MDIEKYRKRKREYAKTPEQRQSRTAYMRIWREKNRDKHNQQARESHARNKHKHVKTRANENLLRKYGITLDDKLAIIASQNNLCAICKKEFTSSRSTHLDHCHKTNTVRGVLCNTCNTKLGWLELYGESITKYLDEKH